MPGAALLARPGRAPCGALGPPSMMRVCMSSPPDRAQTTRLLRALGQGQSDAAEQLLPLVYDELHRLAAQLMGRERKGHTLQATALLNEAFLRLCEPGTAFDDRAHFLKVAARAMRHVLVDHARARQAHKRAGSGKRVDLDEVGAFVEDDSDSVLAVDETLGKLAAVDAQLAQLVELRYFGGLANPEIAKALGMSLRSVERGWLTARAWLARELEQRGT
jgi:RNA polymerase sigma-70 factor, ECF subfamily